MFKILGKSARTGIVTTAYPRSPAQVPASFRGAPAFDFASWKDARPAAAACPTGAISIEETGSTREVTVDYGLCTFCGECAAGGGGAVRMSGEFELAARSRDSLLLRASYEMKPGGAQGALKQVSQSAVDVAGREQHVRDRIHRVLGRSLAIRQVDAGSCNGCELEITALNNPVYDISRLGIHFVASPRHADMLLVTGPVTRNMELALRKTYNATPPPKLVVAAGACGVSGGIYGRNYATLGAVDLVVPVDVYIPGCPPRPQALLQGILLAVGRMARRPLPEAITERLP